MASKSSTVCYDTLKFLSFDALDDALDDVSSSSYSLVPSDNSTESSTSTESSGLPDHVSAETPTSVASSSVEVPRHKSSPLKFPPCVICGGKASGLHYGCNTCEACKNFYRRHLIKQNVYICSKKNSCDISFTNKSNCSACRLAKCLDVGMSKTKSKLGRYTYNRRTETIKKVKNLEGKECKVSKEMCSPNCQQLQCASHRTAGENTEQRSVISEDTEFDESFIQTLTKAVENICLLEDKELQKDEVIEARCKKHYEMFQLKNTIFGSMKAVSMEEYHVLLKEYGIDLDESFSNCMSAQEAWEGIINRYCDYAKALPGFSELSKNDQTNLLKSTHCFTFTLLMHRYYRAEYNVLIEADGKCYHLEECCDKILSRSYMVKICKHYEYLQKLQLTNEEMTLLVTVCTFSADCCKLENYELVERLQTKYFDLLSLYLHTQYDHSTAVRRFTKLLDSLIRLRDVSNMYYQEMKSLNDDKVMKDAFPLLERLVPTDE